MKMREEIKKHLTEGIIPFWKGMRDDEFGGYYGFLDYDLNLDKRRKRLHPEQQDHLVLLQRIYTVKRRKSVG